LDVEETARFHLPRGRHPRRESLAEVAQTRLQLPRTPLLRRFVRSIFGTHRELVLSAAATLHVSLLRRQTVRQVAATETRRSQDHSLGRQTVAGSGQAVRFAAEEVAPEQEQQRKQRGLVPQQHRRHLGSFQAQSQTR
jgi:hypothetical protein